MGFLKSMFSGSGVANQEHLSVSTEIETHFMAGDWESLHSAVSKELAKNAGDLILKYLHAISILFRIESDPTSLPNLMSTLEKRRSIKALRNWLANLDQREHGDKTFLRLSLALIEAVGNVDKSLEMLKAIRISKPNCPEVLFALGVSWLGTAQGVSFLEQAVSCRSNFTMAHYYLGLCHKQESRIGKAKQSFLKALELNPKLTFADYHLGCILYREGPDTAWKEHLSRVVEADPKSEQGKDASYLLSAPRALVKIDEFLSKNF